MRFGAPAQYTVGLYGPWGSGKSSLLQCLRRRLTAEDDVIPVFFDAWRYGQSEHIEVSLVAAIHDAFLAEPNRALRKQIGRVLGALVFSLNFNLGVLKLDPKSGQDWLSRDDTTRLRAALTAPFEEMHAVTKHLGSRRVVVLIDDLDRCAPARIVDVLEAINVLMDVPGLVFVIALDYDVLVGALEQRYPHVSGHAFVEKLVQIPFRVPPLVLDSEWILRELVPEFALPKPLIPFFLEISVAGLGANPRQIKRLYNVYLLLCDMTNLQGDKQHERLLAVLGLQLAWPDSYRSFQQAVSTNRVHDWLDEQRVGHDHQFSRYIGLVLSDHADDEWALHQILHLIATITPQGEEHEADTPSAPELAAASGASLTEERSGELDAAFKDLNAAASEARFYKDDNPRDGPLRLRSYFVRMMLEQEGAVLRLYITDPRRRGRRAVTDRLIKEINVERPDEIGEAAEILRARVQHAHEIR